MGSIISSSHTLRDRRRASASTQARSWLSCESQSHDNGNTLIQYKWKTNTLSHLYYMQMCQIRLGLWYEYHFTACTKKKKKLQLSFYSNPHTGFLIKRNFSSNPFTVVYQQGKTTVNCTQMLEGGVFHTCSQYPIVSSINPVNTQQSPSPTLPPSNSSCELVLRHGKLLCPRNKKKPSQQH